MTEHTKKNGRWEPTKSYKLTLADRWYFFAYRVRAWLHRVSASEGKEGGND